MRKLFYRMMTAVTACYLRFRRGTEHLRRKQQDVPDVCQGRVSQLRAGCQVYAMTTQTRPAQARSRMLPFPRILVQANFSSVPDSGLRKENVPETAAESVAARLAIFPLFAGMNRGQLALLAGCAVAVQFKKGEVIFSEGDLADRLYLIETGKVSLESSRGTDDPRLGWSWMFPPQTRTYTTHAIEPVTAIFFYGSVLRECCENDHSLGYELLKRMSFMMYQRRQTVQNRMLTAHDRSGTLPVDAAVAA